jgi:glucan phosphoethanolaminetransferase (alkaline phosphatase superfamily)
METGGTGSSRETGEANTNVIQTAQQAKIKTVWDMLSGFCKEQCARKLKQIGNENQWRPRGERDETIQFEERKGKLSEIMFFYFPKMAAHET